jgi:serine/threonine protein kinase
LEVFKDLVEALAYCSTSGVAHCDIKPSNILLVLDKSKRTGYAIRMSDFGTSICVSEERSEQMIYKEATFRNFNKFMTPLYAAPNIITKASMINYYQEDVFSLGVTFLQMMGLFSSEELAAFNFNGHNADLKITSVDQLKLTHPYFLR